MSAVKSRDGGGRPAGTRTRTRICSVGTSEGLPELVGALRNRDDVEVVHEGLAMADSADVLAAGGIEAVLYTTDADAGWSDELKALRKHTRVPVVVLASSKSGAILDEALEAGAVEALLLPQGVENVAFALRRAGRNGGRDSERGPRTCRVVTVFSPKGGIGKTVVATNLAALLAAETDQRTLLVDLDLQFGDTAIVLGIDPETTLHDIISAPGELDAEKLAGYVTRHSSGLDVLPAPLRPQDADLVSEVRLAALLDIARETYDVIVIDTAPFLHGPILTALDQTSDLLVICSPEVPALKDVNLSLNTLALLSFPQEKVRLVINHAHQNGGLKPGEIEDALGLKIAAEIPNDRVVSHAVNRGIPAVLDDKKAEFTQALRRLSALVSPAEASSRRRSLFRKAKR